MDRRFEIVITEVCEERRVRGQEWKIGAGDTPEEYGHTPEIEKMEQRIQILQDLAIEKI